MSEEEIQELYRLSVEQNEDPVTLIFYRGNFQIAMAGGFSKIVVPQNGRLLLAFPLNTCGTLKLQDASMVNSCGARSRKRSISR